MNSGIKRVLVHAWPSAGMLITDNTKHDITDVCLWSKSMFTGMAAAAIVRPMPSSVTPCQRCMGHTLIVPHLLGQQSDTCDAYQENHSWWEKLPASANACEVREHQPYELGVVAQCILFPVT